MFVNYTSSKTVGLIGRSNSTTHQMLATTSSTKKAVMFLKAVQEDRSAEDKREERRIARNFIFIICPT